MKYYLLCLIEDGTYIPEFGDYDKECVRDEQVESYENQKTKIITLKDDKQSTLDEKLAELNGKK